MFFLASRYIKMGVIDNCVILSAETYGKYIEKSNRSCNTIFSDGASAIYQIKKQKLRFFLRHTCQMEQVLISCA